MATTDRVTVTLPAQLVERIDKYARSRSHFITEAVENDFIRRRRREGLLLSLTSPHPETTELVDTGLADWAVRHLADDDGLVDRNGGKPVRWIEGEGWVEDLR